MLRRQVALHMVKFPYVFQQFVQGDLGGESYVSFCSNVFHGNAWGNEIVASAVGHMWNVAINIVLPTVADPLILFHNCSPDIVIIGNGGPVGSAVENTHFSASRLKGTNVKLPGSSLTSTQFTIKNLRSSKTAFYTSKRRCERSEKFYLLRRLRSANHRMSQLDKDIKQLTELRNSLVKNMQDLLNDLKQIGIDIRDLKALLEMELIQPDLTEDFGNLDPSLQDLPPEEIEEGEIREETVPITSESQDISTVSTPVVVSKPEVVITRTEYPEVVIESGEGEQKVTLQLDIEEEEENEPMETEDLSVKPVKQEPEVFSSPEAKIAVTIPSFFPKGLPPFPSTTVGSAKLYEVCIISYNNKCTYFYLNISQS